MFAVIHKGGKQHKVSKGDVIEVNRLEDEEGSTIEIDNVLLVSDGKDVQVGEPVLGNVKVKAKVLKHKRGDKIVVFKMKAKKRYQKTQGHRQDLTELEITDIATGTAKKSVEKKAEAKSDDEATKKAATKKTTKKTAEKKTTAKKSE